MEHRIFNSEGKNISPIDSAKKSGGVQVCMTSGANITLEGTVNVPM